jgi:Putative polyhydroxyalkanoic acid system protein (PHA_gran_rgn)
VARSQFGSNRAHARTHYATTVFVSDTVTVLIAHRLGKVEAVRRLKEGFARTNGHLGAMIAMEQGTWEGDILRFRMRSLGQTAAASIEVLEDALRIEVSLPWLLAKAAKRLLPILRKEATLLLEKK